MEETIRERCLIRDENTNDTILPAFCLPQCKLFLQRKKGEVETKYIPLSDTTISFFSAQLLLICQLVKLYFLTLWAEMFTIT